MFGGLTRAMVAGVRSAASSVDPIGYRGVFGLVAAFSISAAVAVGLLPSVAAPPAVGRRCPSAVARDPRVLALLCAIVLGYLGIQRLHLHHAGVAAQSA
ncbi:hypothetical protein BAY59_37540 [Prauserella coralliicola]|nr:hypothetical protein BAY59_37540 [Prauserella coralliicola]